jgi:SPP1 gp7 family putative phage head morphogenesis protein
LIQRAYQITGTVVASLADHSDELSEAYLNLIKRLYKGNLPEGIDIPTTIETAQNFMQAVFEGFGGDFSKFKYDSPDYNKLAHLEEGVYQFSGAKNWQMMRDLTGAIKDGDKVLTFKEWDKVARNMLQETYEGIWKKTEYNTAITGGQMASKGVDYDKHPEALIEYRATEDQHECPICKPFNGKIRPWNDPFWKIATPPNHFGCRCNTVRLNGGKATADKDMPNYETIPKMFRTNLAHNNLIFPDDSHYYILCPKEVLTQAMAQRPYERRFETIHEGKNGGYVKRHIDVDTSHKRYPAHEAIAIEKANKGHHVEILPEVYDPKDRENLLPGVIGAKNPDLKIDGELVEVKNPESSKKSAVRNNIKKAGNQAHHIIINLPKAIKMDESWEDLLKEKFKNPSIKTIEFRHKGVYQVFPRKDYV